MQISPFVISGFFGKNDAAIKSATVPTIKIVGKTSFTSVLPSRATGCVSWKFEHKGVIEIDNSKGLDEDELEERGLL